MLNKEIMIREIPNDARPRERLLEYGSKALSDQELLAILLRTGYQNNSALQLALQVLSHFGDLATLK